MGTVAGIDNGYFRNLRGILGCTFDEVAHHDDVSIVGYHRDGVFQRLPLGATGNLGVGKADDAGS